MIEKDDENMVSYYIQVFIETYQVNWSLCVNRISLREKNYWQLFPSDFRSLYLFLFLSLSLSLSLSEIDLNPFFEHVAKR